MKHKKLMSNQLIRATGNVALVLHQSLYMNCRLCLVYMGIRGALPFLWSPRFPRNLLISVCPGRLSHRPFVACNRRNNPKMASTLLFRMRKLQQPVFLARSLNFRQIAGSVTHEDKKQNSRKEKRRRKREEGMRTHAMYHMKVKEIASEFRLKRVEEEKILNTEEQRKEDLRWQERKTHDGIIESINLENKLLQMQRWYAK